MNVHDALVIGGGPAGSVAAAILARAGWSVALVEAATFPRRKVCGEFVSAATWPVLDELGSGALIRESAGPPIMRVALLARGAPVTAEPSESCAPQGWGRALARETLDLLLLEEARRRGVQIWQPWRATRLAESRAGVECTLTRPGASAALAARVVVDAQGTEGRCRSSPAPRQPHRSHDLLAFKARFDGGDLPFDTMPLLAFPGGYGGIVTSDGGRLCLSFCIRRDALEACRARRPGLRAGDAVLEHIRQACPGVREMLAHAARLDPWLATGPLRPGLHGSRDGGARLRAGNAAGEAHPVIAEGISMAIQGAHLLATTLVSHLEAPHGTARRPRPGISPDAERLRDLSRLYREAWGERFARRVRVSVLVARLAMSPGPGALFEPLLRRYPSMLNVGARLSGKTGRRHPLPNNNANL